LAEIGPHYDSAYETVIPAVDIAAPCGKLRKSGMSLPTTLTRARDLPAHPSGAIMK
jgi:hypothetical protein